MPASGVVDQPLTGFNYSYWFECSGCGGRVCIEASLFELQCTSEAAFSVCQSCGAAVDITRQSPTLRDTEDVALHTDSVEHLVWYHTSRYENWPDLEAYTGDIMAEAQQIAENVPMVDADRRVASKLSLAVHLGTYEATIENMLRRVKNQDLMDVFQSRYWLHRVEIAFDRPGDLHPEVVDEFRTMFGDVELADLHELGARAVRYVNVHEAKGSVSLAIDPALVFTVATIELPVAEATLNETVTAAAATANMVSVQQSGRDALYDAWRDFVGVLHAEYLASIHRLTWVAGVEFR